MWGLVLGILLCSTPFLTYHFYPDDFFSVFPLVFLRLSSSFVSLRDGDKLLTTTRAGGFVLGDAY